LIGSDGGIREDSTGKCTFPHSAQVGEAAGGGGQENLRALQVRRVSRLSCHVPFIRARYECARDPLWHSCVVLLLFEGDADSGR